MHVETLPTVRAAIHTVPLRIRPTHGPVHVGKGPKMQHHAAASADAKTSTSAAAAPTAPADASHPAHKLCHD
jgi:hypothetical protein